MDIELRDLVSIIKEGNQSSNQNLAPHPYEVGKVYLIRTVTMFQLGRLKAVYENELVLEDASWIADTGNFSESLSNGVFNEVEPFKDLVIIGRGGIIDATTVNVDLPLSKK